MSARINNIKINAVVLERLVAALEGYTAAPNIADNYGTRLHDAGVEALHQARTAIRRATAAQSYHEVQALRFESQHGIEEDAS